MIVGGEVEDDLHLRVLGITSGASAGPLLRSFLTLVAFTACDRLSSLIIGLRVEERREKGTFDTPVCSLFFVFLGGVCRGYGTRVPARRINEAHQEEAQQADTS